MYYYGGGSCGCGNNMSWSVPYYPYSNQSNNNYAIILVLFILLVIVIGARYAR